VSHWDWVLFNYWLRLAQRLRDLGCDITFICPRGEYVPQLREAGFAWREWSVSRKGLNPHSEFRSVVHLAKIYRACRVEAAHHFTLKPILYGSLAARVSRVPAVFNMFSGLGYIFSNTLRARAIRAVVIPALGVALRLSNGFTHFETAEDCERFIRLRIVPSNRGGVVPGSVATNFFRPEPRDDVKGPPIVLMGARLLWKKGVRELVDAAHLLKARGLAARVQIAGTPDPGNPGSIPLERLEAWGSDGTTEFLGHRTDMRELFRAASIAALPTSYNEGVPRFLLEGAAAGLPLVASDLPGCRTVVRDGENGFIIAPGDVQALTHALATLLGDSDLRRRMGRASRRIAVEEFDDDQILERYIDLYRQHGLVAST